MKDISKFLNQTPVDKTLFGNSIGLAKTFADFNKSYTNQFEGIFSGLQLANASILKSAIAIDSFMATDKFKSLLGFTHAVDLGIKNFIETNKFAIDRITESTLAASRLAESTTFQGMRMLENWKFLDNAYLIQKNLGSSIFDTIHQLELNPVLKNGIASFLNDIHSNTEKYKEILETLEVEQESDGLEKSDVFQLARTWVISHLENVQDQGLKKVLAKILLYILVQIYLQDKGVDLFKEYITEPHVCVARLGCSIREQGSRDSKRISAVPNGSELAVIDDRGRWKKVIWVKESGDVVEGWVSSSLLKWKSSYKTSEAFVGENESLNLQ